MPAFIRHKTDYPGVTYIEAGGPRGKKVERVYYIRYRRNGVMVEEKVGRQYQNAMTEARASQIRADRIRGKEKSNRERRETERAERSGKRPMDCFQVVGRT